MDTLKGIHRSLATLLTSSFSAFQKTLIDVTFNVAEEIPYSEFVISIMNPSCSYTCNVKFEDYDPGIMVIDISPNLAFSFIDRMLGGKGEVSIPQSRALTSIEQPIVEKVVNRALENLISVWEQMNLSVTVEIQEFYSNPEFLHIAIQNENVAYVDFEVSGVGWSGMIRLCYPYSLLEPILSLLTPQRSLSIKKKSASSGPRVQKQLERVPSEVAIQLGTTRITIRDLLDLREGDVLTLDTKIHEPSVLFVGDRPKFLARPGRSGQSLAVEILRPITPEEEEKYITSY
jgi:flagellar motor switch protein FliM